ncbi:MAG: nucleoside deaminase [Alphaproteobacteria bacterium]|nr:nucleoside deaminase [Alphaproteobacteria bacterium]MCL2505901.1 nucleoside deaminase [Alphaproteobacteria bacterium]
MYDIEYLKASLAAEKKYMELAFLEAQIAEEAGEVPVGAVVVSASGEVLASAGNRTETEKDPTAHAEVIAIREAAKKMSSERLAGCDLYCTLEPCAMCAAAISYARIQRLFFAAYDVKAGAVTHGVNFFSSSSCHHSPEVIGGIEEQRAASMLKKFFSLQR